MEEEKGEKIKEKDTKKKGSKNKLSAVKGEMDLAEAVGGGDAEGTLRDQPTVPIPRNDAVTPRIHQILCPTGQEKAENSFLLSPGPLFSFCFSQKLWEIVVRGFPWCEGWGMVEWGPEVPGLRGTQKAL